MRVGQGPVLGAEQSGRVLAWRAGRDRGRGGGPSRGWQSAPEKGPQAEAAGRAEVGRPGPRWAQAATGAWGTKGSVQCSSKNLLK